MRPSMFMGGSGLKPATYIGSRFQTIPPGDSPISLSAIAGADIDDYVFIVAASNSSSGYLSAAGWTADNFTFGSGYRTSVLHRRITSLSVTINNPTSTPTGVMIGVYRGASRATRRSVLDGPPIGDTLVIPGLVRNNDCVGVVSIAQSRVEGLTTVSPSSGFTRRVISTPGVFTQTFADALAKSDYVDGTSVTWSNIQPYSVGMLYEMRL